MKKLESKYVEEIEKSIAKYQEFIQRLRHNSIFMEMTFNSGDHVLTQLNLESEMKDPRLLEALKLDSAIDVDDLKSIAVSFSSENIKSIYFSTIEYRIEFDHENQVVHLVDTLSFSELADFKRNLSDLKKIRTYPIKTEPFHSFRFCDRGIRARILDDGCLLLAKSEVGSEDYRIMKNVWSKKYFSNMADEYKVLELYQKYGLISSLFTKAGRQHIKLLAKQRKDSDTKE